jgi:hypothetical protein
MKLGFQDRFQVSLDDRLSDPVRNRRHTPSELHYILTDLWDRLRSSTRFTRYEGSSSPS